MSMEALIAPLLRVRLFQSLSERELAVIARSAEKALYRAGTVIAEAGQDADAAILIVDGACERLDETLPGHTEPIEAGSLIGEMAMLVEHVYGATVVARGNVKALRLTRAAMHGLIQDNPSLAEALIAVLADRLHSVADQMRAIDSDLAALVEPMPETLPSPVALPAGAAVSVAAH